MGSGKSECGSGNGEVGKRTEKVRRLERMRKWESFEVGSRNGEVGMRGSGEKNEGEKVRRWAVGMSRPSVL